MTATALTHLGGAAGRGRPEDRADPVEVVTAPMTGEPAPDVAGDVLISVAGWAENLGDGTVEAVFEGGADAVDAMVAFVRGGPGHSTVSSVDVSSERPEGLTGFSTR